MHPVLVAGRGLECLDDAQGYANPGATMLDRLGSRDPTNWDANTATLHSGYKGYPPPAGVGSPPRSVAVLLGGMVDGLVPRCTL